MPNNKCAYPPCVLGADTNGILCPNHWGCVDDPVKQLWNNMTMDLDPVMLEFAQGIFMLAFMAGMEVAVLTRYRGRAPAGPMQVSRQVPSNTRPAQL